MTPSNKDIRRVSDLNLVRLFVGPITMIENRRNPESLSQPDRDRLKKYGIVATKGRGINFTHILTDYGLKLLEELREREQ